MCFFFFFFQAEDGIRDYKVTGVQTCALPISTSVARVAPGRAGCGHGVGQRLRPRLLPTAGRASDAAQRRGGAVRSGRDRKSTRLNSSHLVISYAVFCLKKKKTELICDDIWYDACVA